MPNRPGQQKAQGGAGALTVRRAELERLLSLTSNDPHAVLGAHPTARGVVVRALRPDAERVELIVEEEGPREMSKAHPAGLFEILLEGRAQLFPYLLRVFYPGGNVFTMRDPYAFMPTLGTFDEQLFGEGRHWRLYEKLGPHVRQLGSVRGVTFAVRSTSTKSISALGDASSKGAGTAARSRTARLRPRSQTTASRWASRTSNSFRSKVILTEALGAIRSRATTRRPRATATPTI